MSNYGSKHLTFYKKYVIIKEKWRFFRRNIAKDDPFGGKVILHHIYYNIFFIKNQLKTQRTRQI